MSWFDFIVASLCIWRVSTMLVIERGPWDIFMRIREKAGIQHDEDYAPIAWSDTLFANLLQCVWCVSVWISILYVVLYVFFPMVTWLSIPFALSAVAILIDSYVHKG